MGMIKVSRLNKQPFILNADLIQFVEETPDTVVTLVSNEKILVSESADELVRRVIEYRRTLRLMPEE